MAKISGGRWLGVGMIAAAVLLFALAVGDVRNGVSFGDGFDFLLAVVLAVGGLWQLRGTGGNSGDS